MADADLNRASEFVRKKGWIKGERRKEQHPPEQEEAKRIAEGWQYIPKPFHSGILARAHLDLLAAYEDRSKENKELRERAESMDYAHAVRVDALEAQLEDRSKAFEDAAADCVRLEGALGEIAGRDWQDEGGRIAAALARDGLNGTGRFSPAEAEDEQHAHAEHLREARERQEEKHGE